MMSKNDWTRNIGKVLAVVSAVRNFTGDVWARNGEKKPETGKYYGVTPHRWVTLDDSRRLVDFEIRRNEAYRYNTRYSVR